MSKEQQRLARIEETIKSALGADATGHAVEFWRESGEHLVNEKTGQRLTKAEFESRPRPHVETLHVVMFLDYDGTLTD